jgi:hypothetical protein
MNPKDRANFLPVADFPRRAACSIQPSGEIAQPHFMLDPYVGHGNSRHVHSLSDFRHPVVAAQSRQRLRDSFVKRSRGHLNAV